MPSSAHHFHIKPTRHTFEQTNAEISRLMDPSYHPHSSSLEPARAYVDHLGEMHDPDYQDFPVFPAAGKTSRGRRRSDPSRSRPQWDEYEEDEEDEEELQARYHHRRNTRRHRSSSRDYPVYSSSSSLTASPSSSFTPLPPCEPYISVFEEKPHSHHSILPKRFRRHSSGSQEFSYDSYSDDFEYDDHDAEQHRRDELAQRDQSILRSQMTDLSCSQAIKKQWLAVSLSVRFQLFRARRRASSCKSRKD
ncbi:hypothetical protein GYMLUDRAFT_43754 [Collybiopsis luxurians FD-317 M1]|uniref:Uncharacterized protein n=1 Tax=Collybiopsis luxurians FD-317 M1 TaxID=944289 RepID=A0A0D0CD58_9AGAR|nr:hypothetical protein GYMLUDRAFT_43754 [Collybiopsis luxurians FD-317 M1]